MSVHKWFGETVDTICFIFVLTGSLFLFSYYWDDVYQLEYAEHVVEDFFDEAEKVQMISTEGYRTLIDKVTRVNGGLTLYIQVNRNKQIFYHTEIGNFLREESNFELQAGDVIVIRIGKNKRERSVLSTVIWW